MPREQNKIWYFFTKIDFDNKIAKCNACDKDFSYKSTSNNLRCHLKHKHPLALTELYMKMREKNKEDEDSNDSGHQSDVWNYFEQETGGRVRCVVCRASRPNNPEELRKHMVEKHPTLLGGQDTVISDESSNEDDSQYTEVVYLEEEPKKKPSKFYLKETKPRIKELNISKKADQKRRVSTSSDDMPIKKKREENPDELDTFLKYIKCLLRQVPNEVCTKLQLDIVNLIMKAKLSRGSGSETVLESSMNGAREGNGERSDAISVALADAEIVSEAVDHCYNEVKDILH